MTAKTSEKLAQALDEVGLHHLADRARDDEFHDFRSPHELPEIMLVELLDWDFAAANDPALKDRIRVLRLAVINGEYDASTEESDEWAASPEGQAAFDKLKKGE